jgi:class 3 adenylate cyclase
MPRPGATVRCPEPAVGENWRRMNTVLNRSDLHCALCGNSLRALARFCDACGSPINSRHAALERKQVTILFADVVESMRLAATLESERLREIMHQLLNLSAAVIQRYRGTVDKFTGDGLMAMFGAPVALEDHAVRACIAAVEIQSIARVLAEEVRRRDNVDLQLLVLRVDGSTCSAVGGVRTHGVRFSQRQPRTDSHATAREGRVRSLGVGAQRRPAGWP